MFLDMFEHEYNELNVIFIICIRLQMISNKVKSNLMNLAHAKSSPIGLDASRLVDSIGADVDATKRHRIHASISMRRYGATQTDHQDILPPPLALLEFERRDGR